MHEVLFRTNSSVLASVSTLQLYKPYELTLMESNNKNYYILGAIAVAIIVGAVYLFSNPKKAGVLPVVNTTTTVSVAENQGTPIILYADIGFLPNSIEVPVGTKVTFKNQSVGLMRIASAVHPTHQELPGFDQLTAGPSGSSYEYTFTKAGTWKYHDHLNPGARGVVIVK